MPLVFIRNILYDMRFIKDIPFKKVSIIVACLLAVGVSQAQQDNAEAFRKALHFADSVYNRQEYEGAKAAYLYADRFQPGNAHVKQRVAEIDVKLAEQEALNQKYTMVISEARQALNASDLAKAKERIEYALTLKPKEQWPLEKLAEINKTLSDRAELQKSFDDHMSKANSLFSAAKYKEAKSEYEAALKLIPDDTNGKNKLAETNAKIKEIDNDYKAQIAAGDKLYLENELEEAKKAFQIALDLKPDEQYPKQKIEQINHIIADEAAMSATLDGIVKEADRAFDRQDYALASKKYTEALDVLSTYTYARERLQEIERIIGENQAKRLAFDEVIAKADAHYNNKRYEEAKSGYEEALTVLPEENYPKQRITEIDRILAQQLSDKENLDRMIAEADALFDASQWLPAKAKYNDVLAVNAGDAYATQRIKTIDATLAQMDKDYASLISRSDNFFRTNKYTEALELYTQASELKPTEAYPREKIIEINNILGDKAAQQQSYDALIADADAAFNARDWAVAVDKYTAASAVKPSETYPKQQLQKANKELQAFLANEKKYNDEILRADVLFNDQKWSEAITAYQLALKTKPSESYPVEQIALAEVRLGDITQLENNYKALIADGDIRFKAKEWEGAIAKYETALELKPGENYPKVQIDKAYMELEKLAVQDASYQSAIQKADSLFSQSAWRLSIVAYESAIAIKSGDSYAQEQIVKARSYIADEAKIDTDYNTAIAAGDKLFNTKKWNEAIVEYNKATSLKQNEQYPKDQITLATQELQALTDRDDAYNNAIAKADNEFAAKDYTTAKESYQLALTFKPTEKYPAERIAVIDKMAATAAQYNGIIEKADALYNQEKWNEAITAYTQASNIQPEESYPKERIQAINNMLGEQADLQTRYAALLSEADAAFKGRNWQDAIASYQNALTLKPQEAYPQQQIDKANNELKLLEAQEASYASALQTADSLFNASLWNPAILAYQSALKLKPADSYPPQQIEKAKAYIADAKKIDSDYNSAIVAADKLFNTKKWNEAITEYNKATALKPAEQYPKEQIALATAQIQELEGIEVSYNNAVAQGDSDFAGKRYAEAKDAYQNALSLKPAEKYPAGRISEIDKLLTLLTQYNELITSADLLYGQENWNEALKVYTQAGKLQPEDTYPQERIVAINKIVSDQADLQSRYTNLIGEGDAAFKAKNWEGAITAYQTALSLKPGEAWPQQQIDKANEELGLVAALEADYRRTLNSADSLFGQSQWEASITAYQAAVSLKPAESYPKGQISKANAEIKALVDKETNYNNKVSEGDDYFAKQDWTAAKTAYEAALQIKPQEAYPQAQIGLAEEQLLLAQEALAAEQAREESYKNIISQADIAFHASQWTEAIGRYQEALVIKPSETYPQKQIDLAGKELEKIAANRKLYDEYIAKGDNYFQESNWEQAKASFTQASKLFPEEQYPLQRISSIDEILADIARLQEQYNTAIASADAAFSAKSYEEARGHYEEALRAKSNESYPTQRLREIENILDAEKAAENARLYREAVTEANTLIAEKNLQAAIVKLNSALEYKPGDEFATKKVAELQKTLDDAAFAASEYERLVAEGDTHFKAEKYREAIAAYRAAMRHQPNEVYPRKKVAEAERNLEYTPERRRQLAQESMQRGQDAENGKQYEAAMRAYANAYYWYPEDEAISKAKLNNIISTLESGSESKEILEQPLSIDANRRGMVETDIKPSELKGTTYALIKVSGDYENNVNMFVRWGRLTNESGAAVVTLVYGLDTYYCVEIKGASGGLTWISVVPENADLVIREIKLVSK